MKNEDILKTVIAASHEYFDSIQSPRSDEHRYNVEDFSGLLTAATIVRQDRVHFDEERRATVLVVSSAEPAHKERLGVIL